MTAAEHPAVTAARLAASALTMALDTERRAALEVEARGGERSARVMLDADRQAVAVALLALAEALAPMALRRSVEVTDMADGAARGFARGGWVIRVMQIAAEVASG